MISGLFLGLLISGISVLNFGTIIFGAVLWVVFLNGGTMAINSYYDNDKGDIGWLDNPPKVPKYLHIYAVLFLLIGLFGSAFVNYRFFSAYFVCFILSVLYSVPPFRWKEKAGFDVFVNFLGYGVLTTYAGYALLNIELSLSMFLVLVVISFIWAAGYPLTQLYQDEEDKERNYKTFTCVLGKKNVFKYIFVIITFSAITILFSAGYGYFRKTMLLFMFPLYVFGFLFLLNWYKNYKIMDEKKEMYKGSFLLALFDVCLVLGFLF